MKIRAPRQVALGGALLTIALLIVYLAFAERTTSVYVLNANVESGAPLSASLLTPREVRANDVLPGMVTDPAMLDKKFAKSDLYAGMPVPVTALVGEPAGRTLPGGQTLRKDETVFPVTYDAGHGPLFDVMLKVGDTIDLLWAAPDNSSFQIVMSRVEIVYAVAGDAAPRLYLRVDRKQATQLAYLTTVGKLFVLPLTTDTDPIRIPVIYLPQRDGLPIGVGGSGAAPAPASGAPTAPAGTGTPSGSAAPIPGATPVVPAASPSPRKTP